MVIQPQEYLTFIYYRGTKAVELTDNFSSERFNVLMANGQMLYKNRTLIHNLLQTFQETSPFVCYKQPRKPACYKARLSRSQFINYKVKYSNFCHNWPQVVRT
jgi:hypothetical protein